MIGKPKIPRAKSQEPRAKARPVRFRTADFANEHREFNIASVICGNVLLISYLAGNWFGIKSAAYAGQAPPGFPHGALQGANLMRELKTWVAVLAILAGLVLLPGFGSRRTKTGADENGEGVPHYISVLKSGTAQQKAAAAYWLGQQRFSGAEVVNALAELLGDKTAIDASRYRQAAREQKPTLGEEAAAALVVIGRPSIPQLIHVLKTSPLPEARKNAAWALGALHESSEAQVPVSA